MATFAPKVHRVETPLPPFLRKWFLENPPLSSCSTHDHLALIYEDQAEQLDIVVPFIRLGLERGQKCIYIADDNHPDAVMAAMERHGIDVESARRSGALATITKYDAYLKNGEFDPDWMIGNLVETVESARKEGFESVRVAGEMTWALGPAGEAHNRLIEYECKLNHFFPAHNMVALCQYNRRRFRPETLMHVIQTHPWLVYRGEVCENPHYLPPEIFLSPGGSMEESVRRLLDEMAENTRLRRKLDAETVALRRSERGYRELMQALPVAVYTTDAEGRVKLFNEAAAALAGRMPRAGEDRWCVTHRLYRSDGSFLPHEECPLAKTLRTGEGERGVEAIAERPDGTRAWFMPHPTVIRDVSGEIRGGINVLVDITKRKRAESLLVEQKQALELIATDQPLEECLLELTAAVTRLTPTATAAVSVADRSGKVLERIVSANFPSSMSEALEGAAVGGVEVGTCGRAIFEGRAATCADMAGDERWPKAWRDLCQAHGFQSCHSSPVFTSDGRAVASVCLAFAEARVPDEFELGVAEFCARIAGIGIDRELAQERQRIAEAALRRSEQLAVAGRMAAAIAHEINNPLEAITNLWYLLEREDLTPAGRSYLQSMGGELSRVSHIAKQTLEFYRMGRSAGAVDLRQCIEDAAQLFSRKASSRGAAIHVDDRAAATLIGFSGELRQLFANLISNALEAGAGSVRIRTAPGRSWEHPSRRGVRILVADNGAGISPEAAERIFEPFFTTKEEKGTGLGLWVSQGIVHKHAGSLRMRSCTDIGRSGTAFSIFLPTA